MEIYRKSHNFSEKGIAIIEHNYKAKWMGTFCVKNKDGNWANVPVDIFYQYEKPNPEYSDYFGLFYNLQGELIITSGESAFSEPIVAADICDGRVIYSAYRHDYNQVGDVFIDGGRDYVRSNASRYVHLVPEKDKLVVKKINDSSSI